MPGIQFGVEGAGEGFAVKSAADITLTMLSAVAVGATPVVLLPAGALYGATLVYFISSGSGSIGIGGIGWLNKPAIGTDTFVATIQPTDKYTFSMLSDGSLTVARTLGTFSCLVNVLIMYG